MKHRFYAVRAAGLAALFVGCGLVLLMSGCKPREVSDGVQLVLSEPFPGPGTPFELRFDEPMAAAEVVGRPNAEPPMVIAPPVRGSFVWQTSRSGAFTPEEPLKMDTLYTVRLRADLKGAEGKPAKARLMASFRTEPFEVVASVPNKGDINASSEPEIRLVFNANVTPSEAQRFLVFHRPGGAPVMASARLAEFEERLYPWDVPNGVSLRTWEEQYASAKAGRRPFERFGDNLTNAVSNLLVVTPSQPLPMGDGWVLSVKRGLPDASGTLRTTGLAEVPVGNVVPLALVTNTARHSIGSAPEMSLEFSKLLPERLTNDWRQWVTITPPVEGVSAAAYYKYLVLSGDFASNVKYTVNVAKGFPTQEACVLEEPVSFEAIIPPLKPQLNFPAFSAEQLATGARSFPLRMVNVGEACVRVKWIEPGDAVHVLRGYRGYQREREEWRYRDEGFHRLDYNMVPGRTVHEQVFQGAEGDEIRRYDLDWNAILKDRKTGVVFLDAERGGEFGPDRRLGAQAVVQITDIGLVWKRSSEQTAVFVFSHATGLPMPGATVRAVTDENETLAETVADGSGIALFSVTNADWLVALKDGDFHAVEAGRAKAEYYEFNLRDAYSGGEEGAWKSPVFLFTDRALYRPGDELHVKAIARDWAAGGMEIPAGRTNHLTVFDPRLHKVLETNLCFSAMGSLDFTTVLPDLPRGGCVVELRSSNSVATSQFSVEDFQPSAFEISLSCKPELNPGEVFEAPVSARYFFGKPLNRARVKWWIDLHDGYFHPEGFDGFRFCERDNWADEANGGAPAMFMGLGELTNGFAIRTNLYADGFAGFPRAGVARVEITDVNQQTLSRETGFVLHGADFYLGIEQEKPMIETGDALEMRVAVVSAAGKLWTNTARAKLVVRRIDWQPVRIEGAGRKMRFRNERIVTNVLEKEIEIAPAAFTNDGKIAAFQVDGIVPTEPGTYVAQVSARDSQGRETISTCQYTVVAKEKGEALWKMSSDSVMSMEPGKSNYCAGDTAEILVKNPFEGTALVTVERERVRRSFVTNLTGNSSIIRVPIEAGDAPNVYVSATLVRGSAQCPREAKEPEYRTGYCELMVEDASGLLGVAITAASTNCLPGATVSLNVAVSNALGQPAAGAEIVLFAVDEGVLSLMDAGIPDPFEFFHKPRPLFVRSGVSLPNLLTEDPKQFSFVNKGYTGGDGSGDGGMARVRRRFLACAFWNATLQADEKGVASVQFPAPDAITRYRVVAVAQTAKHQFGKGQSAFSVAKPLLIEPALPRFGTIGDQITARAVVQNQTDQAGEVIATLTLDGKSASTGASLTARVAVAPRGSAAVEFPVSFSELGRTVWVWKARFAEGTNAGFADAVESVLNIGPVAPLMRQTRFVRIPVGGTNLLAGMDAEVLSGAGEVKATIANTRLIDLSEAVSQLLHYPYGCVEQTGSSLLPWIALQDCPTLFEGASNRFVERAESGPVNAEAVIRAGIRRLFAMQTRSGGLSYWPGGREPMPWGSAYGCMVLALAKRHGAAVPEEDFDRLTKYLSAQLRDESGMASPSDICLTLYALALAGKPEPAYQEAMYTKRGALCGEDCALLALAVTESGGLTNMAQTLVDSPHAQRFDQEFGSGTRESAMALLARLSFAPQDARVDGVVESLVHEQRDAHWGTTQGNAWALLALSEYARRIEKGSADGVSAGTISWGSEAISFALNQSNRTVSLAYDLKADATSRALVVSNASGRPLFATATVASRSKTVPQTRLDRGVGVVRRYERLDDDGQPQPIQNLRVGDRVLVTLEILSMKPARYVAVDDALPSLLEVINPQFANQASGPVAGTDVAAMSPDYKEMRTDRMLFFVNSVGAGKSRLQYIARVRAAGTAVAPATRVEAMYDPDRFGFSETQTISSKPME
jgi:uncharacterized protein YfaS (alpha-2-macroglobulin family)